MIKPAPFSGRIPDSLEMGRDSSRGPRDSGCLPNLDQPTASKHAAFGFLAPVDRNTEARSAKALRVTAGHFRDTPVSDGS